MICQACKNCLGITTVNFSACCPAKEGDQIVECTVYGALEPVGECDDFEL